MIFTYTFRDHSGASVQSEIDAVDRAAAFAALRSRGIVPIKVESGEKRRGRPNSSTGTCGLGERQPSVKLGLWCGVVLLALTIGGTLWWWQTTSYATSVQVDNNLVKGKNASHARKNLKPNGNEGLDKDSGTNRVPPKKQGNPNLQSVSISGDVKPFATLPLEANTLAELPERPAPIFSNVTDQVISMVLSPSDGGMPPIPLTPDMEKAFLKSLKTEIVILDSDDEKTKALKLSVKETREEIKRLMDKGMTFAQVIREHQHLVNENAKLRQEALVELKRLRDSGDVESAVKYKHDVNATLRQMGIKELSIPVTEEERAERDAARQEHLRQRREQAAL